MTQSLGSRRVRPSRFRSAGELFQGFAQLWRPVEITKSITSNEISENYILAVMGRRDIFRLIANMLIFMVDRSLTEIAIGFTCFVALAFVILCLQTTSHNGKQQ